MQILGGQKLLKFVENAGEIFLSGLRGAKNFSNAFRIVFSDPFSCFSNRFSYRFKSFSGAVSLCRHAALVVYVCFDSFVVVFLSLLLGGVDGVSVQGSGDDAGLRPQVHQNRASPFASDNHFYRRPGYRREFRNEDHFYLFSSQKKSWFASEGHRASWGLKKSRDFSGSGKNRRAILVHSGFNRHSRIGHKKLRISHTKFRINHKDL